MYVAQPIAWTERGVVMLDQRRLPATPPLDVTVAVNATDLPKVDGFSEEATDVDVIASTFCVRTDDVLPAMLTAPP